MVTKPEPNTGEPQEVVSTREARQGPPGRPILMLLGASLLLAVVAAAFVYGVL